MEGFLIVSKLDRIKEYKEIANQYKVGFEINDFFDPVVLDDERTTHLMIQQYLELGVPEGSTMHGAFYDIALFSSDNRIVEVSLFRVKQSMEIAKQLGVKGVVFHTNSMPMLSGEIYDSNVVNRTAKHLETFLKEYPNIDIYLENMFDDTPKILSAVSEKLQKYKNYGVCLDYAHASISKIPMSDWVEQLAPYLRHIHINDNDLKKDLHWALGTGQIDWNLFVRYYRTYFDQCSVLIETTQPEAQIQSLKYLKENFVGVFRD